jgi:lysozyme
MLAGAAIAAAVAVACGNPTPATPPAAPAAAAPAATPERVTASPSPTLVHGIDVSHDQSDVNWTAVRAAGITFAFAKATEGMHDIDPRFTTNWPAMRGAGLVRGAYHFFTAAEDGAAQAAHFLATVSLQPGDLPPVLDVEQASGVTPVELIARVRAWLSVVEQRTGRVPIIYTNHSFWNAQMDASFARYPLWVAEYGVTAPRLPEGWPTWTFWQHSEGGAVSGVTGPVDLSQFNGTAAALTALTK